MDEPLNPDLICEDCQVERTSDGEWVMDVFQCYDNQDYCLNCCHCEEHEGEPWYEKA